MIIHPRRSFLAGLISLATFLNASGVEKGFTSIFNGKDLTGWEGMPGMWTVKDGAITPKQSTLNNWVFWRGGQPADFELRLSFRYHSGNSGVQVRTAASSTPHDHSTINPEVGSRSRSGVG